MRRSSITPSHRWPRLLSVSGCLVPSLLVAGILASPAAGYITGTTLVVDGGLTAF